jgi:flagellar hook-length control protein FliK
MNTQAQQAPSSLQYRTACRRMSVAAVRATPPPVAPTGDNGTAASAIDDAASAFADLVAEASAASASASPPVPTIKPKPAAHAPNAVAGHKASSPVDTDAANENAPTDPATGTTSKEASVDAPSASDKDSATAPKDDTVTAASDPSATAATVVIAQPPAPATDALTEASLELAGSTLAATALAVDTAPAGPEGSNAAAAFDQAVNNASTQHQDASEPHQTTAASAEKTGEPTPSASQQAAQPDASASEAASASPTPGTETPARPPQIEAAATPATPLPAAPQPPATTTTSPTLVAHTGLSHLSQATLETTVQIAAQITRKLDGRSTRFEMGLTPEGLGRVDVSLDIDSGGRLTARLAFDNPLAATELRGKADELRRELQNAGFTVAHDGLDFSERQSSSGNGFDRQQGRAFASASRITADPNLPQPASAAWVSLSLTRSGVDMKV